MHVSTKAVANNARPGVKKPGYWRKLGIDVAKYKWLYVMMIPGIIYFILISFIIKRFSLDCRHTPWPSLWPKH